MKKVEEEEEEVEDDVERRSEKNFITLVENFHSTKFEKGIKLLNCVNRYCF